MSAMYASVPLGVTTMSDGDMKDAVVPWPSRNPPTRLPSTVVTAREARLTWRRLQLTESRTSRNASPCHGAAAAIEMNPAALPTPSANPRNAVPAMVVKAPVRRSTRLIDVVPQYTTAGLSVDPTIKVAANVRSACRGV